VQGLGSVSWALRERLRRAGARLTVSAIDSAKTDHAQQLFSARVVDTVNLVGIR
jgi:leucine dehydrogenase